MTDIAPHMIYVYCGLLGCVVGAFTMAYLIMWIQKGERNVSCKAHGECLSCQVDGIEDAVQELNAIYEPLKESVNDVDSKLAQQRAQMRAYIDEQLGKITFTLSAHSLRMDSMEKK